MRADPAEIQRCMFAAKEHHKKELQHDCQHLVATKRERKETLKQEVYPEHIIQASLLSILHWSAASALSSARRLASSYEISSSSDGPGDSGRLAAAAAAADLETDTDGEGAGTADAVVAIETCLRGATKESAETLGAMGVAGAVSLAAAALSLASV
jgi:hypothetical protein